MSWLTEQVLTWVAIITTGVLLVFGAWWLVTRAVPTGNERFEKINYQGTDCIVYHSGYKGGLSCNWQKGE